jgi:hypothetical protein
MKRTVMLVGMVIAFALIAFPVMAGGSKDKSGSGTSGASSGGAIVAALPRDAASFEGTWACETFTDTYTKLDYDIGDYVDVAEPSSFVFWQNDVDGVVYDLVESPLLEPSHHYNPEYTVTGDTLTITVDLYADDGYTDIGRGEYAVFRIAGDTLVRTVNGTEHIYTKRD